MALFKHHEEPGEEHGEHGEPPPPAHKEKAKDRRLTYIGVAAAVIGVIITIVIAKRGSGNTTGGYSYPTLPQDAGAGGPGSNLGPGQSSSDEQYQALAQQLADFQTANLAAQSGFQASLDHLAAQLKAGTGTPRFPPGVGLQHIDASKYPHDVLFGKTGFDTLGVETASGYQGKNVSGGAPVYAKMNVGGVWRWVQGILPSKAPVGTVFGTPSQFRQYEVAPKAPPPLRPVANPPHGPFTPSNN